jgi:hypothetical protein
MTKAGALEAIARGAAQQLILVASETISGVSLVHARQRMPRA